MKIRLKPEIYEQLVRGNGWVKFACSNGLTESYHIQYHKDNEPLEVFYERDERYTLLSNSYNIYKEHSEIVPEFEIKLDEDLFVL